MHVLNLERDIWLPDLQPYTFNAKVGMDWVSWRNAKWHPLHFVHFIDEGTLFHLGAVIEQFETVWVSWAGVPQEVYVDPGSKFVSEDWATKMQKIGAKVHMSARDSHWQLGRAEIHGATIKQMLTRMD